MNLRNMFSLVMLPQPADTAQAFPPTPMNPLISGVLKAMLKPISQKANAPVIVSNKFFITTPLQCCLLVPPASRNMKPSYIKKMSAEEVRIQDELAPVLISSSI